MSKLSFLLLLISSKLCLEGEKKKRRTLEKENEGKWGKREGGKIRERERASATVLLSLSCVRSFGWVLYDDIDNDEDDDVEEEEEGDVCHDSRADGERGYHGPIGWQLREDISWGPANCV
jgi:hypothetical protein